MKGHWLRKGQYDADMASYAYLVTTVRYESSLYCLETVPLYRLLAPDRVVSVDISRADDGAILLEASFVDDRTKAPRGNADFISGHIQRLRAKFDPVHYCLREAAADFNGEIEAYKWLRVACEYDVDEQGRTRPIRVKRDFIDREYPDIPYSYELRFRRYERNPSIDDDIFTLEHYGLVSPPAPKPAGSYRTPPWLYYFVGGVLCVAVGAFFAHRAIRQRASNA